MALDLSVVMPVYNERHLVAESVRRVLAVESPRIRRLELIIVDDGSSDGSREILRELAEKHPDEIRYVEHPANRGKGASVRTGFELATGDVTVIHDADLEYDPRDFDRLMVPFEEEDADAVYGSRFTPREYRRVLYYRHAVGNQLITTLCNLISDLNLTDMETCYKAIRTPLLQSIPLVSDDFRIEPEITIKLSKRGARVFEVPINYAGRTYEEGKKIGFRDAVLALVAMVRFALSNDVYRGDVGGAHALVALSRMPRFNGWMADEIRPHVGSQVLEIGAGIGNLSRRLLPRDRYVVSDVNDHYLGYLRGLAAGKPYMHVDRIDLSESDDFYEHLGRFDTVICLNVLEHVRDDAAALRNLRSALAAGGRAIVLVPQGPEFFGSLDEAVGHCRRYTRESLQAVLEGCGLDVEQVFDFNRASLPGWWLSGRLLRRRTFSPWMLWTVERLTWLLRRLDRWLPWPGNSLVAVARLKPEPSAEPRG